MDIGGLKPSFGGHEKFVFRHGWLKKGVDAVQENPLIFTNDNALTILGVGKNMVRSIRHWCLVMGLLEEKEGSGLAKPLTPTTLAKKLVFEKGWDPYFEDSGSLWLLHWQLTSNLTRGLVWNLVFSTYLESEFTKKQLHSFLSKQLEQAGVHTTSGSIEREIDCCLHTYVPAIRSKPGGISEESLDCPLAELDLVRYISDDNVYRFNVGPKMSLPLGIFGFALLSFLPKVITTRRTVAVDECVYHQGSPGQVFKLDENSVIEYLESMEELTKGKIRLQETAGLRQIYLEESVGSSLDKYAFEILKRHYEHK